ncbi:F0F1 ATP synthase subunit B [Aquabacter sp. P-9]|uniref:F0F1 ATP synthase subunit B n=1 Tax=Aquabacter sediminis TaxID=3029197 RepID=UPI00237E692E|nr:F0F1 ATP synthase subunit B [Aquabacter sp. P-9]MDE1569200.1 F0F1 ATP synthase subunit B [Aquabacter sp. P-9]
MTKTWKLIGAAAVTGALLMAGPVTVVAGSDTAPQRVWNTVTSFVVAEAHAAAPGTGELAHAVHGEHGGDGEHGGFPPFNPTHFASQLFWLALTFGALYFLMSRVTLPRIGRILEERHDRIARDLEEASQRRAESEAAQAAYEKALVEARNKANAIAGEARNRLAAETETNRKSLEASLAAKLEEAERRIGATKTEAMSHVRGIAVDTANTIVSSLVGTTAQNADVEQAVDAALAQKTGA